MPGEVQDCAKEVVCPLLHVFDFFRVEARHTGATPTNGRIDLLVTMLRGLLRWGSRRIREGSEEGVRGFCRVGLNLHGMGSGSPLGGLPY
jgi:hypothetical protein